MSRVVIIAIALQLTAAGPLDAWGVRGHRIVNRAAVRAIPDDGPIFVKAHLDWIGERGRAPDTWRRSSEPFVKIDEDPNHGWFKEQFSFMPEIPRSRYEFVLRLYDEHLRIKDAEPERARLTNVRWTGTLPYAAVETYERIKSAMRVYRRLEQEQRDTRFIEMDIAFYVGWLGHYIGDGGMPLYTCRSIMTVGRVTTRAATRATPVSTLASRAGSWISSRPKRTTFSTGSTNRGTSMIRSRRSCDTSTFHSVASSPSIGSIRKARSPTRPTRRRERWPSPAWRWPPRCCGI